jgi:hypothetical protein
MVDLRHEVAATPNSAPAMITRTLRQAGANAPFMAAPATVAAIQGLGPEATRKQVAAIVYAAVRVVPAKTLRIVRAAVSAAPNAASEIAAAAVRAVPNPWKEVRYQHEAPSETVAQSTEPAPAPVNREPDFKSPPLDHSFEDALSAVLDPAAPGDPMTLAEAIVQSTVDAHPGLDYASVQGAVDAALYGDPGSLFNAVGGVRGNSGVGDAGNSNYANEPHLPGSTPSPSNRKTGLSGPGKLNFSVVSP